MPHEAGLWYEWHGPEDGEVLILSPGLGGSANYWAPNLEALSARYRVLLYDHRGTGRSDEALPDPVSIETMAADLFALMQALGIRSPSLIGHAVGGLIGLELTLCHDALAKLVIVNGWAKLDPHTARCFDVRLELLRKSGAQAYLRAQPLFLYPPSWVSEYDDRLDAEAKLQLAHFPPVENVEKRIAAARAFELWLDITCPVLALASADDMLVPAHCSQRLADQLPVSTLETLPWGGHACNVTCPDHFNQIVIAWLGAGGNEGAQ
jgi:aminoacrylate hydrolase